MRAIKKTVKTTIVDIYKPDMDTMSFNYLDTIEIVGGLGERLATSRAKKQYGKDVIVKCHNVEHVYKLDADTFLKYATVCDDEVADTDTDTDSYLD